MDVSEWDLFGLRLLLAPWKAGQPPMEVRFQDLPRRVPREQIHPLSALAYGCAGACAGSALTACNEFKVLFVAPINIRDH
ncbi:hypothetical protein [Synechococcus sp. UW179A]|uniref:hypothetical protein n=1 Tax=Synechococcus sp. UW179A TaxID=2575510 RepID=UPI000E0E3CC0|nr:hypothetical protein [Synechococcus sp. UW179A]